MRKMEETELRVSQVLTEEKGQKKEKKKRKVVGWSTEKMEKKERKQEFRDTEEIVHSRSRNQERLGNVWKSCREI